jgi:hypothetical protein
MIVRHAFTQQRFILIDQKDDGWTVEKEDGSHENNVSAAILQAYDPSLIALLAIQCGKAKGALKELCFLSFDVALALVVISVLCTVGIIRNTYHLIKIHKLALISAGIVAFLILGAYFFGSSIIEFGIDVGESINEALR